MEMAIGFLKKGVVDYLVKPVEKETLTNAVAKAIAQRKLHSM